ncbi:MAG TPA: hypothetical protein VNC50_12925, partial [Planctomycetia bacterium]|nr:hypothetical protein [Planctomycetia bacterium]
SPVRPVSVTPPQTPPPATAKPTPPSAPVVKVVVAATPVTRPAAPPARQAPPARPPAASAPVSPAAPAYEHEVVFNFDDQDDAPAEAPASSSVSSTPPEAPAMPTAPPAAPPTVTVKAVETQPPSAPVIKIVEPPKPAKPAAPSAPVITIVESPAPQPPSAPTIKVVVPARPVKPAAPSAPVIKIVEPAKAAIPVVKPVEPARPASAPVVKIVSPAAPARPVQQAAARPIARAVAAASYEDDEDDYDESPRRRRRSGSRNNQTAMAGAVVAGVLFVLAIGIFLVRNAGNGGELSSRPSVSVGAVPAAAPGPAPKRREIKELAPDAPSTALRFLDPESELVYWARVAKRNGSKDRDESFIVPPGIEEAIRKLVPQGVPSGMREIYAVGTLGGEFRIGVERWDVDVADDSQRSGGEEHKGFKIFPNRHGPGAAATVNARMVVYGADATRLKEAIDRFVAAPNPKLELPAGNETVLRVRGDAVLKRFGLGESSDDDDEGAGKRKKKKGDGRRLPLEGLNYIAAGYSLNGGRADVELWGEAKDPEGAKKAQEALDNIKTNIRFDIGNGLQKFKFDSKLDEKLFNSFLESPTSVHDHRIVLRFSGGEGAAALANAGSGDAGATNAGGSGPSGLAGVAAADGTYAAARKKFRTKLQRVGPAPAEYKKDPPPSGAKEVAYSSGALRLKGWLAAPSGLKAGEKRGGVIYFHGGHALSAKDFESCKPLLDAGYFVFLPTLRGENGNPGDFELLGGELEDAIAAVRWFGAQPGVDPARMSAFGHDAGGALAGLLSLIPGLSLRETGSYGGLFFPEIFVAMVGVVPFDGTNKDECRMRVLVGNVKDMQRGHLAIVGEDDIALHPAVEAATAEIGKGGAKLEIKRLPGFDRDNGIEASLKLFVDRLGPAAAAENSVKKE